ncbi:hypothetical protein V8G54_013511 [Vigna mungo]|uniref:VOC domain-containing protein n=1 Tax=Vigna mungo TaxID=3915 RepID=A0AAQ3NTH9_VIGMU
MADLLEWPKKDNRRMLHVVYRVGDLDRTIKQRDIPDEKYANDFLGFGPEESHFVVELTYNYGVTSYEIGDGFGHFAIATQDIYKSVELVRAKGGSITREPGPVQGGTTVIRASKMGGPLVTLLSFLGDLGNKNRKKRGMTCGGTMDLIGCYVRDSIWMCDTGRGCRVTHSELVMVGLWCSSLCEALLERYSELYCGVFQIECVSRLLLWNNAYMWVLEKGKREREGEIVLWVTGLHGIEFLNKCFSLKDIETLVRGLGIRFMAFKRMGSCIYRTEVVTLVHLYTLSTVYAQIEKNGVSGESRGRSSSIVLEFSYRLLNYASAKTTNSSTVIQIRMSRVEYLMHGAASSFSLRAFSKETSFPSAHIQESTHNMAQHNKQTMQGMRVELWRVMHPGWLMKLGFPTLPHSRGYSVPRLGAYWKPPRLRPPATPHHMIQSSLCEKKDHWSVRKTLKTELLLSF